jgi:hypothetical protein
MLVPLVDATAVPEVITLEAIVLITAPEMLGEVIVGLVSVLFVNVCVASVPANVVVASGSVNVRSVAVDGAAIFRIPAPLALPEIFTELMGSP